MDCEKIGKLIYKLRKNENLTQKQLAEKIGVTDKAISKWERGLGCPDISLLTDLSYILNINLNSLLSGEIEENEQSNGNMKNLKFYVCPICGNILTSTQKSEVYCCDKKLEYIEPIKAEDSQKLSVEKIENDYFISSNHEMTKNNYICFIALLTGDTIILKKQYPEWNLQTRIPIIGHGKLLWYCSKDGLLYQNL